jgi:hypothetical protein
VALERHGNAELAQMLVELESELSQNAD